MLIYASLTHVISQNIQDVRSLVSGVCRDWFGRVIINHHLHCNAQQKYKIINIKQVCINYLY